MGISNVVDDGIWFRELAIIAVDDDLASHEVDEAGSVISWVHS